jgi:uncharacterized protein YcbK (DUF882 family)
VKGENAVFDLFWSRRSFIKGSLIGALMLLGSSPAFATEFTAEEPSEGRLSLFNTHSRERMQVTYRDKAGNYDFEALNRINWILRCHFTGEVATMDIHTLEFLNAVDNRLGGNHEIHIISGYRSPRYNNLLLKEGHKVARHSLHMEGKAIDIQIPGVSLDKVRKVALNMRYGGVGYYPGAGFVHIDSGNFRSW